MTSKRIIGILTILIIITSIGTYLLMNADSLRNLSQQSFEFVEKSVSKDVNTAEPLRKEEDDEESFLSVSGVIEETNRHRQEAGLAPLEEDATLNAAAQSKVEDMFDRQYFEHEAPTGEGAGDLATEAGYEFISVGENLALGNYKNDQVLVQAWMDSPGHRENILKPSYTEIGVAVVRGTFEGKETWIAVQHFAKPLSACPTVSESLKSQIDNNNAELDAMKNELQTLQEDLQERPENRDEAEEYNNKVDEHNNLVNEYNDLLNNTKNLVNQYNQQVNNFNSCAKE